MSDRRYTAIFGAAVLTAGVATFSVYRLLRSAAEPRREPTRAVVVLAQDVPAGVPVPREALSQVPWPERVAPPEAFASVDSVAGRVARVNLTRGEPVRATALAPRGANPGLEGTITPDHRAIAVRVNEATGVSGLVRPNSRVDVLVTSRGDNAGTTARLVMADVRVLGVGPARPAEPKEGENKEPLPANVASIVTLEVTPAQAAAVAAAEQQGTVQVVLRGFGSQAAPASLDGLADALGVAGGSGGMPATPVPAAPGAAPGMSRTFGAAAPPATASRSTPPRPVRHASAGTAAGGAGGGRQAPPNPQGAPARPAVAAAPDSAVVQVFRGGQLTVMRVAVTPPPRASAAAPPPPPAPAPVPVHTTAASAP